jgi:hypothetical protein
MTGFRGQGLRRLLFALTLAASGTAFAEPVQNPDIIVTAPYATFGVMPERALDSSDVEAYGLGTVAEVIAELIAENGDDREDPAYLINGKRVRDLGNVADLPAEAVLGIEVLPRGSGARVGASPRQRVYNIRLRRELDLAAAQAAARLPTGGEWSLLREGLSYTHIRAERRFTLAAKRRDEAMLLESERDIVQPVGSIAEAGRFRSLSGANDRTDLSLAAADRLASWLSGSFGSKLSLAHRHTLLGPAAAAALPPEPLDQRGGTLSASADLTLSAQAGRWQFGLFGNYAYQRARTSTDRLVVGAPAPLVATTRSIGRSLGGQIDAFGPVLSLPAGPLVLNLGAGLSRDRVDGRRGFQRHVVRHGATVTSTTLSAAIEIPIASSSSGVLAGVGDLSASGEIRRQQASDFGRFHSYALSLLWRPVDRLSLTGSLGRSGTAPPAASLDEPALETPGYRYFDPLRAETVDVTRITGGSLGLRRQSDRTKRFAANFKPFRSLALRGNAEYFERRSLNFLSELPPASLSLIQAFPERFIRDASGRLIAVDERPLSFASRTERQLRTGLILSLPLGNAKKGTFSESADEDEQGEAANASRARSGMRPRLQLSASHSWMLGSALTIRAGQPSIDLLSPGALGLGGAGQPRHRLDASLGYAERGLGIRAALQSRGASFVEASAANVLRFEPLTTFSLRAWVQGERLAPRNSWMKGTRLSLSLLNATNGREKVVDRFGATPLSYQSAYRDPIGRSLEIEFRKKF